MGVLDVLALQQSNIQRHIQAEHIDIKYLCSETHHITTQRVTTQHNTTHNTTQPFVNSYKQFTRKGEVKIHK